MKRPKKKRRFMDRIMRSTEQPEDDSKTSSDEEPKEKGDESMNGSDDKEYNEQEEIEVEEVIETTEGDEDSSEPTPSAEAAASAQTSTDTVSETDEDKEKAEQLAELSPDYFGKPRAMSLDEIGQLVEDAEQESDDKQKEVSKLIAIQFAIQPGLAEEMKDRKDFRHARTIDTLKRGGVADLKLGKAGINTAPLSSSGLQELYKCPNEQIMADIARKAIAEKLSVRDIRKLVTPFVRRAKMEASGALTDMSPQCAEIIEALEDPEKLMQQPKLVNLLRDSDRLKDEFTFPELSGIHGKANAAEAKIQKQKRALEEKGERYVPVINFLRLIRKTISAVWGAAKS